MFASEFGQSQAVKTLLRYSADVNLTTVQGKTALMLTIEARHLQVIHLFGELNYSKYADMPLIQYRSYSPANLMILNSQMLNMLRQSNVLSNSGSFNDTQFTFSTHKAITTSSHCSHKDQITQHPIYLAKQPSTDLLAVSPCISTDSANSTGTCPHSPEDQITQPIYAADKQLPTDILTLSPCISTNSADSTNTSANPISPQQNAKKSDIHYLPPQKCHCKLCVTAILALVVAMGIMFFWNGTITIQLLFHQYITTDQSLPMPASHNRYTGPTLKDKPKLKDLITIESTDGSISIHIIEEVATSCRQLGYMLGLNENLVQNIWHSGDSPSITEKCEKTIENWRKGQGKTPVTWETFIAGLKQIEMMELSRQLHNILHHEDQCILMCYFKTSHYYYLAINCISIKYSNFNLK